MAEKNDNYEVEDLNDLVDALMEFPVDGIPIEQGDSNYTEEEIEQMAQGKTLAEIRGQQNVPEASAPAAQPGEKQKSALDGFVTPSKAHEEYAKRRKNELSSLYEEWRSLQGKKNTKRKQKALVERAAERSGDSYDHTLEEFERRLKKERSAADKKSAAKNKEPGQEKAAEPVKAEEAKAEPPAAATESAAAESSVENAAQPKRTATVVIKSKKPGASQGVVKPVAEAGPATAAMAASKAARAASKSAEAAAEPLEGEKALPYIKVTTDGQGRAQLGARASAPSAKWRVEVIDPKTGEPLPFGDDGETFVDLVGHPLLNYARLEHDLRPKIKANVGKVQKEIKGVVDSMSKQEEKFESDEETAAFNFDSVLGELAGTDAYRYLTQTKFAVEGENGAIETTVAPWQMVKLILQRVVGHTGGEGSSNEATVRVLMDTIGIPSFEQAERLIDSAYKLTSILPETADKLARRRHSKAYWDDQFSQGLNLGGNFQSMYNHMLMDSNDRNRPMMIAFKNGQRQDIIDWDNFYDTVGPVGKKVRVYPSLDLPFLYADSDEAKAMLDAARGEDGKISFEKLEDALDKANAELFGEGRYLELMDDQDVFDDDKLARALRRRFGEGFANGDKELLGKDAFRVLNKARNKETGEIDILKVMKDLKLDENKGARNDLATLLLRKKTLVPDWELIKKYGTLQRSLGENWARFIRGTGGFNFQGGVSSKRLGPGSDLGDAQYNPVLRNLYARAITEAPEVAKVLHDYYLNYGEDAFSPSVEQLLMFARQPELLAGNTLDWLYSDEGKGKGKLDNATGLSKNNLDAIADSLSDIIWFPGQAEYDVLNEAFPGVYVPTGDFNSRGRAVFDKSEELASKIKPIKDAWNAELRRQGRKRTTKQKRKATGEFASGGWYKSPEWQKLVLRAFFEELMENPDTPRRLIDPAGFEKTYAPGNVKQLEGRQKAVDAQLLEAIRLGKDLTDDDWDAFAKYDIPIAEARDFQYRLAKRMLDMMLNGTKNVRYVDGKGLVRILPSDKRVKKPVRRGKGLGARFVSLLANPLEGQQVSDKRAKEPSDWESWEARRKVLIGEDW